MTPTKRAFAVTLTHDLNPDVERGLLAQAQAHGVSLKEYVQEIVAREAHVSVAAPTAVPGTQAKNLVELFANSPFKGLSMEFERDRDFGCDDMEAT